jgi:hypothetical protein
MAVDVGVGWRLADGAGVETVVLRASIEDVQSLRLWGGSGSSNACTHSHVHC